MGSLNTFTEHVALLFCPANIVVSSSNSTCDNVVQDFGIALFMSLRTLVALGTSQMYAEDKQTCVPLLRVAEVAYSCSKYLSTNLDHFESLECW